jgi:hypothetical protein
MRIPDPDPGLAHRRIVAADAFAVAVQRRSDRAVSDLAARQSVAAIAVAAARGVGRVAVLQTAALLGDSFPTLPVTQPAPVLGKAHSLQRRLLDPISHFWRQGAGLSHAARELQRRLLQALQARLSARSE